MTARIGAMVAAALVVLAPALIGVATGFSDAGFGTAQAPEPAASVHAVGNSGVATQVENRTNETGVAPGTKLAGVVSAQQAEVTGEVQERTFLVSIAEANSSTTKARVVAKQTQQIRAQLQTLRTRLERLTASHSSGNISDQAYRVQVTHIQARIGALTTLLNRTGAVAEELPRAMLRAHGVNRTVLATLRTQARNLTGQEVAAIAHQIAGKGVGKPIGPTHAGPPRGVPGQGPPGNMGPPGIGGERDRTPANNSSTGHPAGPPNGPPPGKSNDSTTSEGQPVKNGNGKNENSGVSDSGNGSSHTPAGPENPQGDNRKSGEHRSDEGSGIAETFAGSVRRRITP